MTNENRTVKVDFHDGTSAKVKLSSEPKNENRIDRIGFFDASPNIVRLSFLQDDGADANGTEIKSVAYRICFDIDDFFHVVQELNRHAAKLSAEDRTAQKSLDGSIQGVRYGDDAGEGESHGPEPDVGDRIV